MKNKVLLLGWDAADWDVISPLLDAGEMPALERLLNSGVMGNISTLYPPLSPILWTSIATGKNGDNHGVLSFTEPDPKDGGIRPVTVASRKAHAIWNILNANGLRSNVVGWWPSHPAEPVNGVIISNFFQQSRQKLREDWGLYEGTIHPAEMNEVLSKCRIHWNELTENHILPFIPKAEELPKESYHFIEGVAKVLAETATIQSVSTYLMKNTEWDFMAIYYDGIDHISHGYMKFHPPQLPGIPDREFGILNGVVRAMYKFHDMMLDRMMQLAGEDTTIIILSDHGFQSGNNRVIELPRFNTAPAIEHRQYGILCVGGKNIKKDERVYGATLLDIVPTILTLFDLPVGRDMEGKVLLNIFEKPPKVSYINSWDKVEGDFGTHPDLSDTDIFASAEALKQLVELGYISDPGEDKTKAFTACKNETDYNLGLIYSFKKQYEKAYPLFESLIAFDKEDIRFNMSLLEACLALDHFDRARAVIDHLKNMGNQYMPSLDYLEGIYYSKKGEVDKALGIFKKVTDNNLVSIGILLEIARLYLKVGLYEESGDLFQKIIETDESQSLAYLGLGTALLRLGQYEEAANQLLTSISLIYNFSPAHFFLGECLYRMGKYTEAVHAFEICLSLHPNQRKALQWLVRIFSTLIHDPEKLSHYQSRLAALQKGEIIVVTGLPRSGTSVMMQILQAGGIEVFTDNKRLPDINNPKGYIEYEAVKSLSKDNSWMKEVNGKAIKIIIQLLQQIPVDYSYKVIFMERDIREVLFSQQKMLGKSQPVYNVNMAKVFEKDVEATKAWIGHNPNIEVLYVNYRNLIESPDRELIRIEDFIDQAMDMEKMKKAIDVSLYRNKSENIS
ncbi:MAG: alkaline phosphatase family protein [Bacteroidetes bacterium]|nr:alkaline phosphatase family protein [Bacteroidota bacterium]